MNDRERLWTYYTAGRISLPRPKNLCVNATLACDGHCGHCGIWRGGEKGDELSADDLGRVLSGPFYQQIETAWITGGEPTLREDINEISRAMCESLSSLTSLGIATNGLDPDRVMDRVDAMLKAVKPGGQGLFIHISLDGVGEVHDSVRGVPGAFEAVSETISRLLTLRDEHPEAGIEIGLNCVVQPKNIHGLDELFSFANERGLALSFNVALVTDQIYRNLSMADSLAFTSDQKKNLIKFLDKIIPKSTAPFQYQYRIIKEVLAGGKRPRRCTTLYTTVNINADGTLIPCPASSDVFRHNVLDEDMDVLWRSKEAREMRRKVHREFCPTCMLSCSLGDSMPVWEWVRGGWD